MGPKTQAVLVQMNTTASLALAEYFFHATNIFEAHDVRRTVHDPQSPKSEVLSLDQRVAMLQAAEHYFSMVRFKLQFFNMIVRMFVSQRCSFYPYILGLTTTFLDFPDQVQGFGSDPTGKAIKLGCTNFVLLIAYLRSQGPAEAARFKPRCVSSDPCECFFSIVRHKKRGICISKNLNTRCVSYFGDCTTCSFVLHYLALVGFIFHLNMRYMISVVQFSMFWNSLRAFDLLLSLPVNGKQDVLSPAILVLPEAKRTTSPGAF